MDTLYSFSLIYEAEESTKKPEPIPVKVVAQPPPPAPEVDPNQPPPAPAPEEVRAQINVSNNENIQKYVLFNKVVNLKYQLENRDLHKFNTKAYNDAIYFLNVLISFFNTFEFEDLVVKINVILDEIQTNLLVSSDGEKKETDVKNT